jgi:hypothetical protein
MQRVLSSGAGGGTIVAPSCTTNKLGGAHQRAVGYVTIDVVSTCTPRFPGPEYFLNDLLYDNVLIGEYENIDPNTTTGNYAGGNPMVHIRAVPEGGPAGSIPGTALPYTFYDRFTPQPFVPRTVDRRQPLPSTFAARYIQGGNGQFNTKYAIWREGVSGPISTSCAASANSAMPIAEMVRFDEHENATTILVNGPQIPTHIDLRIALPAASSPATSDSSLFPQLSTSGDVGGWMYLNLNNGGSTNYSSTRAGYAGPGTSTTAVRQSQNWVTVSMYAEGRYGVEFDAPALGNGCSVAPPVGAGIGPTGNNVGGTYVGSVPICPTFDTGATMPCANNPAYRGTNGTPP